MGNAACCDGGAANAAPKTENMDITGQETTPVPLAAEEKVAPEAAAAPTPVDTPAATPAPPAATAGFTITLTKSEGKKLGLGLNQKFRDGKALKVESINDGGLAKEFGAQNPGQALQVGDVVTSACGVSGDAPGMLAAIGANTTVTLVIERPWKQWEVTYSKDEGPLGLAMKIGSGMTEIADIRANGTIDIHNKKEPATALQVGDFIISCNGSTDKIDQVVKDAKSVKLVIRRNNPE